MDGRFLVGLLILLVVFGVTYSVVEFVALFIAVALHYRFEQPIYIVAAAVAGFAGVMVSKMALDRFFKPYPSRNIAIAFMVLCALVIARDAINWPAAGIPTGLVAGVVAILAAFLYLWPQQATAPAA